MAVFTITGLENHPDGTVGLNGIINANWERLEAIFAPLGAFNPGDQIGWDVGQREFTTTTPAPLSQILTDAANIAWDGSAGSTAEVTLADNRTLDAITNQKAGRYVLKVTQDATGGRTLTLDAAYLTEGGTGVTLTATPGAVDVLVFECFGGPEFVLVAIALDVQ